MFGYRIKRRSPLIALLSLIIVSVVGLAVNAQAGGTVLTPGQPAAGALNNDTIAQVFTLDAAQGDVVTLIATNSDGLALALLLTDARGVVVAQARDVNASGETRLSATVSSPGTYYVTVLPVVGLQVPTTGAYQLTLQNGADGAPTEVPLVAVTEGVTRQVNTASGMQVVLSWNSSADLNLEVRDPVGGTLYFDSPQSANGGAFGPNVNGNCANLISQNASEQASWAAGGVPTGSYEVLVYYQQDCQNNGPVDFTVSVTFDGATLAPVVGNLQPGAAGQSGQTFVTSYIVNPNGTATLSGRSGVNGLEQLPASALDIVGSAQPIQFDAPVSGFITNAQPYQSFTFQAQTNEIASITLSATSGSLDSYLAVLDPNGNVVYFNDDAAFGVTDSVLNGRLFAVPGTYTIVATRYGLTIGGTEGGFTLALTRGELGTAEPAIIAGITQVPGATQAASSLPAAVQSLALPAGNIEITLVWNTLADLQLLVRDPAGESVFDDSPTIRSGGRLAANGNVNCTPSANATPVSYIYWPTNVATRAGSYEIDVWFQSECNDTTPINFSLYATVNGQQVINRTVTPAQPFLVNDHYVTSFTIGDNGVATANEAGITGLASLQWQAEATSAPALTSGQAVNGSITPTNKFDVYSFEGSTGDRVNISMTHGEGTVLDPKLYLIGPGGTVAAENDDAVVGTNRDSLINNFTLPSDGRYIIIATHYGEQYGITSGAYSVTLNQSS